MHDDSGGGGGVVGDDGHHSPPADNRTAREAAFDWLLSVLSGAVNQAEVYARWLQDAYRLRLLVHVACVCYLAARLRSNERQAELAERRQIQSI